MKKELEHKSKGRTVVYVVISVNAAVSVFLIAAMVYSLTRITQQQDEIMNLRSLVQKLEQIKPQSSKQEAAEEVEEEKGLNIESRDSNTVAKVSAMDLLFSTQGKCPVVTYYNFTKE